jgi:heat shock protein HslJ
VVVTTRLDSSFVWTLSNLMNKPLLPGTAITLQFQDGEVVGFASCNSYKGNYTASQNDDGSYSVAIEQLTTTKLTCPEQIMKQEAYYLASLQTVNIAGIQNNLLDLSYPEGVMNFYEIGTSSP